MRQVKCRDTGVLVSASDAWKAPDGKYYSSKGAFEHLMNEKTYRQQCLEELGNILGYHDGQKFPTVVAKKLKEYEYYGYKVVLKTIITKKSDMEYAISHKEFASEYNRVAYIMAIITNSINDVKRKMDEELKAEHVSESAITAEDVALANVPAERGSVRDISKFLK